MASRLAATYSATDLAAHLGMAGLSSTPMMVVTPGTQLPSSL